jgi:hypothetical protein
MKTYFLRWRAVTPTLPCSLLCTGLIVLGLSLTGAAEAQSQNSPKSGPAKAKTTLGFKSTFDQYKPYTDEKVSSWKGANDEVGRIGGWRAYLKEANEPDSVPGQDPKVDMDKSPSEKPKPATPPPQAPARPAGSGSTHHHHSGHGSK